MFVFFLEVSGMFIVSQKLQLLEIIPPPRPATWPPHEPLPRSLEHRRLGLGDQSIESQQGSLLAAMEHWRMDYGEKQRNSRLQTTMVLDGLVVLKLWHQF